MQKVFAAMLFFALTMTAGAQSGPPSGLYGFKFRTAKTEVLQQLASEGYSFIESKTGFLLDKQNGRSLENFHRVIPLKFVALDFSPEDLLNSITLSFIVIPTDLVSIDFQDRNKAFDYLKTQIDALYQKSNLEPKSNDFENSIKEWNVANNVRIRLFWFQDIFTLSYTLIDASKSKEEL